jgi:hypothetical protein
MVLCGGLVLFWGCVTTGLLDDARVPLLITWVSIGFLSTLIVFGRGFFIFRRHRLLACCCFVIATLQLIFFILFTLPVFAKTKGMSVEMSWPYHSPVPTPIAFSVSHSRLTVSAARLSMDPLADRE